MADYALINAPIKTWFDGRVIHLVVVDPELTDENGERPTSASGSTPTRTAPTTTLPCSTASVDISVATASPRLHGMRRSSPDDRCASTPASPSSPDTRPPGPLADLPNRRCTGPHSLMLAPSNE